MLTGTTPFRGGSPTAVLLTASSMSRPADPRTLIPDADPVLASLAQTTAGKATRGPIADRARGPRRARPERTRGGLPRRIRPTPRPEGPGAPAQWRPGDAGRRRWRPLLVIAVGVLVAAWGWRALDGREVMPITEAQLEPLNGKEGPFTVLVRRGRQSVELEVLHRFPESIMGVSSVATLTPAGSDEALVAVAIRNPP